MLYVFLFLFVSSLQILCDALHCRDVANNPEDWWYIYKPASNSGRGLNSGLKFFYISSREAGRWQMSNVDIAANDSMLALTLSPLFNIRYVNYLASLIYQGRAATYLDDGSSGLGLLMADELGGVWMSYTMPDLINLNENTFVFPRDQAEEGHLIMCMSLDLATIDHVANALRQSSFNVVNLKIPSRMETLLPHWYLLNKASDVKELGIKRLNFLTRGESLHGVVLTRPPGDKRCLYKTFAKNYSIVLDVYQHTHKENVCTLKYSVRNIGSISLKQSIDGFPSVWYIDNSKDKMGFAVSTGAVWQRRGEKSQHYWTCVSAVEHQGYEFKAGLIVCISDYNVWLSFDNFKIKEPEC